MTTIAYKDGIVAYDSLAIVGDMISDYDYDKHQEANGVHYFCAGTTGDIKHLINWHQTGDESKRFDCDAIIVDGDSVIVAGCDSETGFYSNPKNNSKIFAIGTGRDFAMTAMDMGASAKEALKMAAYRDVYTGGKIRTFKT